MRQSKLSRKSSGVRKQTQGKKASKIIKEPSNADLKPTEREKRLLEDIFAWQKRSAEADWILGQPRDKK